MLLAPLSCTITLLINPVWSINSLMSLARSFFFVLNADIQCLLFRFEETYTIRYNKYRWYALIFILFPLGVRQHYWKVITLNRYAQCFSFCYIKSLLFAIRHYVTHVQLNVCPLHSIGIVSFRGVNSNRSALIYIEQFWNFPNKIIINTSICQFFFLGNEFYVNRTRVDLLDYVAATYTMNTFNERGEKK